MPSSVPYGIIQAQSVTQRRLMHIEQSVEDISDLFLRVYFVLDAGRPEGATFRHMEVSPSSWDEHFQNFLRISVRCRRNLQDAVAVMDVCRETVLTDISRSSLADARIGLKSAEELMRTKVACGRSALDDFTRLAQDVYSFRDGLDLKPVGRPRRAGTGWNIPHYCGVVRFVADLRTCFNSSAKMSLCRYMSALRGVIGRVYKAAFIILWGITGRQSSRTKAASLTPSPSHSESRYHGYTSHGQSQPVPLLISEPDVSYTYPDTIKDDLERVAVEIERFALTWSEISDEQERWVGYLARRAEDLDSDSKVADESDLTFHNEIAGMWDAIMSIRHATLQRLNAADRRDFTEL